MTENGFKETELGLIPEEWEITRLGDLFEIQQGITLCREPGPGKYLKPFLRTSNVFWSRIDLTKLDSMYFSEKQLQSLTLKSKDLLICEGGDIGRTAIWEEQITECCHQNHLHRLRAKNGLGITPEFYMYWMQFGMLIRGLYSEEGNKTTIPNLSRSRLSNFTIPLPPLPEQKQIAHILSTIQEAKDKTEDVINATKELKKSLMSHLFTYGPVPVSEAEHVKLKETELGLIPEDWEVKKMVDFATLITDFVANGGFATLREKVKYKSKEDYAILLRLIDYTHKFKGPFVYIDEGAYNFLKKTKLKPGDIILCNVGATLGTVFRVPDLHKPMNLGPNSLLLRADESNDYLFYWLKSQIGQEKIKSIATVTAQPKFNKTDLRNLLIPLPSLPKQNQIADMLSAVDSKIEAEENKAKALDALFKTLLENLMTGKLRVNTLEVSS